MLDSYLVTGGNGLLGQHVVRQLLERGENAVAVFDIVPAPHPDERVKVYTGDITNGTQFSQAVQDCRATCIIHTAALIQGAPRDAMFRVNVTGTECVIATAKAHGVRKLVFTSSASVVFDGHDQAGVDESAPYPKVPFDEYNGSKAAAERLVLAANEDKEDGLKTVSLRVAGLFGPGDRHAIPGFMGALQAGRTGMQIGDNTNLFDFTYIPNAALAHLLAADRLAPTHPAHARVAGKSFFITNGHPLPFWDFPRMLWREAGHVPARITVLPRWAAMLIAVLMEVWSWLSGRPPVLSRFRVAYVTATRWCDIRAAREALDYEPRWTMQEGVRETIKWWKEAEGSRTKEQ
ncbi:predicted protein [Postia placenta Mad-698-R]|nr:predicted protein [Postia placenta Mad-698-R]